MKKTGNCDCHLSRTHDYNTAKMNEEQKVSNNTAKNITKKLG